MTESTELTRVSQADNGFMCVNSFSEALEIAKVIAASGFCPANMKGKPYDVMMAMQMGRELGLKTMQAVLNISVINGRANVFGDAMLALCEQHPEFEWIKETYREEDNSYECIVKRKGRPECVQTYSEADARLAGLWGKAGPWKTSPRRMLQWRARGFALRDTFAAVLRGLISREEARDYPAAVRESEREPMPVRQVIDQGTVELIKEVTTMNDATWNLLSAAAETVGPEVAQKWCDWAKVEDLRDMSQRKAERILDEIMVRNQRKTTVESLEGETPAPPSQDALKIAADEAWEEEEMYEEWKKEQEGDDAAED